MNELYQVLERNAVQFDKLDVLLQTSDVQIYGFSVHRFQVAGTWKHLRSIFSETRYWPIIVGDRYSVEDTLYAISRKHKTTDDIIKIGSELDIDLWLRKLSEKYPYHNPPRGPWPGKVDWDWRDDFLLYLNNAPCNPLEEVYIALTPAQISWHIPAILNLHISNFDLSYQEQKGVKEQEIHVGIFRKWEQEYGAEIVTILPDALEFMVAKPPKSFEAALKLAQEHFVYCDDVIYQGASTLDHLAETLMNSEYWVFWWD